MPNLLLLVEIEDENLLESLRKLCLVLGLILCIFHVLPGPEKACPTSRRNGPGLCPGTLPYLPPSTAWFALPGTDEAFLRPSTRRARRA